MDRRLSAYLFAALGVTAVAWVTSAAFFWLGLASSALLFLLPVLFASARGGIGPGLFAAFAGAAAYNFLLLPPLFSFRVHSSDNIVSVAVLAAVALVTSRLATRLKAREADALSQAEASGEAAELSALLSSGDAESAPGRGVGWLAAHYGAALLLDRAALEEDAAAFGSLDLSAAAWALHNGDATGHGSAIMSAAEWTFVPLAPRGRITEQLLAVARPASGTTRGAAQVAHLQELALLLGQASDRAALEREQRERERVEQSDRLRRTLLASLAHDFRTPLTVITGQLATLSVKSPEAGDALRAARRLDRTIDDLFAAARLEEGSLSLAPESLDLVDAVSAACEAVALPGRIAVERAIPADLPFVRADPVLLHHVLLNLLDNAARHAKTRIALAARAGEDRVTLAISDDGEGIPQAERARIFERFARIEGSDRREGSGLGLSIVKGFADAMGIAVKVGEAPEGGASFTLALPRAEGTAS